MVNHIIYKYLSNDLIFINKLIIMNNFIKKYIVERIKSKAKTGYVEKKENNVDICELNFETDIDEIVDEKGIIMRGKLPTNNATKQITSKKTTDEYIKSARNSIGNIYGMDSTHNRYYGEIYEMTKKDVLEVELGDNLGADETILKDMSYDKAYMYFTKKLGLDRESAIEKMKILGYNKDLPDDKIIMVENPKKFIEEYVEELLKTKYSDNEIFEKEEKLPPNIIKQIKALKKYNINTQQILKILNSDE